MDIPCSLPMLAGVLPLCAAVVPASAQTYRPDAEAYPCARHARSVIVQSDLGFSIREKAALSNAPVTATAIKIGTSLALDSRLFARTSLVRPESIHVPQR
ncbi:Putative secreted protein [Sphingopyxis fribergensis]|jgi:hypothetical protein|uniref:Putative secreted protein n=1 Tax=Sphingopyxis fribergensis TaxID=1515612 RepID=A0A0A7PDG0_9SPHN|nr:hypothetical protein [Sphingopyxis fribergensis]AJA07213.1 Putative secreted protein [Sphingopyxis fribergensis]